MTKKTFLKKGLSVLTAVTIASAFTTGAMADYELVLEWPYHYTTPWHDTDNDDQYQNSNIKKVVVKEGVTHIGNSAFKDFTELTSISIPNTVKSIGNGSVSYCWKLESLVIPDSVTSIGEEAFDDNIMLTSVTIGNNVKSIGAHAFSAVGRTAGKNFTITLPKSVTSIDSRAFSNIYRGATIRYSCSYNEGNGYSAEYTNATLKQYHLCEYSSSGNEINCSGCTCGEYSSSTATLSLSSDEPIYYTGEEIKPAVTVNYPDDWVGDEIEPSENNCTYSFNINAGTATCTFKYAEGVEASLDFTIEKADSVITAAPTPADLVYDGTALNLINAGTATGGEMQYSLDGTNYSPAIPTGTDAKTYTVWYKVVGDQNHNDTEPASFDVTIAKATPTAEMFAYTAPASLVYDGTEKSASVSTDEVGMGKITVKYYQNNKQVTPKNAGTYTVKIDVAAGDNYNAAKGLEVGTFEITKATPTVTAPTVIENLIYTGKAQKLVSAGSTNGGTIQYSLEENGTYSTAIPTGKNAGTYTVWYKVVGDSNVNDVAAQSVNVTIAKAPLTITANSYTIKVGTALPAYDYTVAGLIGNDTLPVEVTAACTAADSSVAGAYSIAVSGDAISENYNITYIDGTLTITEKEVQTVTANAVTMTYGNTGKKITAKSNVADVQFSYEVATGTDVIEVAADGTITAKKAGIATVNVIAAATDTHEKAMATVTVTVNKAKATVKANSYTIKVGAELPAQYEYTTTGLVGEDTLDVTITCTATDASKSGTYPITVTGVAETDKYTVTYVNGKLTVGGSSSSGGGGSYGGGGGGGSTPRPEPEPMLGGESTSWGAVGNLISELPYGGEMTIELGDCYEVPAYVINKIAESGAKVTFIVEDNFSCTIDGTKIYDKISKNFRIYLIGLNTFSLRGEAAVSFRIGGDNLPVEITTTVDKKHAGNFANLFRKSEDGLAFADNVRVDANGKVTFLITEAGDYAIMLGEFSDRPGDLSNDGKTTAGDADALLKEITALAKSVNPEVADYNGDGRVNALDASAILIDFKNGKI